jgi:biotin/methionine sulfoxide reductase
MPHVFGVDFLTMLYEHQDGWPTIHDHTETLVMFGGINAKNAQVSMGGITEHETSGLVRKVRGKGHALRQYRAAAVRCARKLRLDARATRLRHRADAGAGLCSGGGGAREPRLPRQPLGGLRPVPPLPDGRDGRRPKSPDWAGPICGAAPEEIRALARRMATTRTLITVAWSLQRAEHGEQPYWMSAVLAAMLGQIGLPGGGVGYGYGAIGGVGKSLIGSARHDLPAADEPGEDDHPGGADRGHAAQSRAGPTISTESGGPIPISA